MTPLKDIYYNPGFYQHLAGLLGTVYPKFKTQQFVTEAVQQLPQLELKQRIGLTSQLCRKYLPDNYKKALGLFYSVRESLAESFSYIFLPDFIARYGLGHFEYSLQALRDFTCYSSSELALRDFLNADLHRTMKAVYQWTEDDNHHVRRLASEGTRPRLPWAVRVPALNQQPELTLPVLQALRNDPEKYVRKSVANHLNDISKDHPQVMLDTVAAWDTSDVETAWIVKHAARSLIKQGHPGALALVGAGKAPRVSLQTLRLQPKVLRLGETLQFSFQLSSQSATPQALVVDYKIHYVKKNGTTRAKVFKLRQLQLEPEAKVELHKKHLLQDFTTRKHYAGTHVLEIVVNGVSVAKKDFELDA